MYAALDIHVNNTRIDGVAFQNCSMVSNCITLNSGCTLLGNTEQIRNLGAAVSVTYSDIEGGYEGEGNIDADPLPGWIMVKAPVAVSCNIGNDQLAWQKWRNNYCAAKGEELNNDPTDTEKES